MSMPPDPSGTAEGWAKVAGVLGPWRTLAFFLAGLALLMPPVIVALFVHIPWWVMMLYLGFFFWAWSRVAQRLKTGS